MKDQIINQFNKDFIKKQITDWITKEGDFYICLDILKEVINEIEFKLTDPEEVRKSSVEKEIKRIQDLFKTQSTINDCFGEDSIVYLLGSLILNKKDELGKDTPISRKECLIGIDIKSDAIYTYGTGKLYKKTPLQETSYQIMMNHIMQRVYDMIEIDLDYEAELEFNSLKTFQ